MSASTTADLSAENLYFHSLHPFDPLWIAFVPLDDLARVRTLTLLRRTVFQAGPDRRPAAGSIRPADGWLRFLAGVPGG
jgi:hypothetical protein